MTDQILPDPVPENRAARAGAQMRLAAAVRRARWTILWERLWPALATVFTAVGFFLAVSWLGVWLWLPPLGRAVGSIAIAAAVVAALIPFGRLRIPALREALSRLDRGSGLRHRPATAIADQLAVPSKDPHSLALWNAHVKRALAAARTLKPGTPAPRVAWRDPYALRALVLLACIATFFAAGGERWHRIAAAFDWRGVVVPANFRVDAWVEPPAYTAKPPIVLPGIHPGEAAAAQAPGEGPYAVPVNSTLIVRSTGNINLDLAGSGGVTPSKEAAQAPAGTREQRFAIAATGAVALRGAGSDITWPFNAIPDNPPTIELTKDPQEQNRGSLLLSYRLSDDYGVSKAEATFVRKDDPATSGAPDAKPPPMQRPLYGPPDFALALPQARTRNGVGQTIKDLTDHPWAGTEVTMTLVAHDDAGNTGKSDPIDFRLPQRFFSKPLARALVEQRRDLALDANTRPQVITALDALAIAPEKFTPDASVYLGLRSIFWSLVHAKSDDDLRNVAARLWQMAVDIEDGGVTDAQQALRNAENALQQALERGASDAEIRQLMDQLRAAMQRYMQALAEQLRNNPQQLSRPLDRNARVMTQRDLQDMLNRLENLAKSGAKGAAQALLQQLEQMMENMQMASPDMNGDEGDEMSELDELGDMIRQQQDLRDRTFKQGQSRQDTQRGQRGKPGQSPHPGDSMGQLQQNQQALRDRLNQLLKELQNRGLGQNQQGQQGQQMPGQGQKQGPGQGQAQGQDGLDQLGRAGNAMGEAGDELGQGDADNAVESQGRALDALRKGAQSLAQSMQQQNGKGQGLGRGRLGEARGDNDTDPLGRPLRGHDYGDDSSVKVPGDIDVQRARRIIEELRRRFGDFARPQEELDYIQRLLQGY